MECFFFADWSINSNNYGGFYHNCWPKDYTASPAYQLWPALNHRPLRILRILPHLSPVVMNLRGSPACKMKFLLTRIYFHTSSGFLISVHFSILRSRIDLILP